MKHPKNYLWRGVVYDTLLDACIAARVSHRAYMAYCSTHPEIREIRYRDSFEKSILAWRAAVADRSHPAQPFEFEGVVYPGLNSACRALGLGIGLIRYSIECKGLSFEAAVRRARNRKCNDSRPRDHTGRAFNTYREMCRAWGLDYQLFTSRRHQGWPLELILTLPKGASRGKFIKDHLGNIYKSERDMCLAWGVNRITFRSRMARYGWNLERALTAAPIPPAKRGIVKYGSLTRS